MMRQRTPVEQELARQDAEIGGFVTRHAHPLSEGDLAGYEPLLQMIGKARMVMIGDGSHGTHEFYRERALITKRLVEEQGFSLIGIEGPWPDVLRLNQYVHGGPGTARDALAIFDRYPTWMWGNLDMEHFLTWLRRYNDGLPAGQQKVSFLGLDVQSVFLAADQVLQYLDETAPALAAVARDRYRGLEQFGGEREIYGYYAGMGLVSSCEREAADVLKDLRQQREQLIRASDPDRYFNALMAAMEVQNGERFHRASYFGGESAWNIRDIHMQDMLDALLDHLEGARAVVWEHNTHVGDFRQTGNAGGQINIGQLTRQRHPGEMVSVGFGHYEGSVTASRYWGGPPEHMPVPQGIPGSYDHVFHLTGLQRFLLLLRPLRDVLEAGPLNEWRGNRAIGVQYHPEAEWHNYVPTRLASRYDAFVHIDRTKAVKPLDMSAAKPESVPRWEAETYPEAY
jgi:erythromycin esterase-like protein